MRTVHLSRISCENMPNMTPLVDVVMVILIFLMLAGTFAGKTRFLMSHSLIARSRSRPNDGIDLDVMISRAADGGYIVHSGKIITQSSNVLTTELTNQRRAFERAGTDLKEVPVVLHPTSKVRYDQVIEVYQAALKAGFSRVMFAKSVS
jgi:biopolymer transport protein ExbD